MSTIDIVMPSPGESVTEAQIASWFKQSGEQIQKNDVILELETDKASLEIVAEADGVLEILIEEGEVVPVGSVLGRIDTAATGGSAPAVEKPAEKVAQTQETPAPAASGGHDGFKSPAVARLSEEKNVDVKDVTGTGKDGRVTKEDVLNHLEKRPSAMPQGIGVREESAPAPAASGHRSEKTVAMSMMRRRIAQRLKEVQNTAAILTTFNEVDLSAVMDLRARYKDKFKEVHDAGLGFMGFFTKAVIEGLKRFPAVNAEMRGTDIIFKDYYDVGVAVSTEKGLVVPVVRNAESLSVAGIEKEIVRLAKRARDGKIGIDEMTGGTFTITNGGVFGSMLSTPILNAPQTAILGMHTIQKRPVVVEDQIVIRPMMYLAVSYDHRVIDGKEAVQFLVTVKQCLEDPARLLLEV